MTTFRILYPDNDTFWKEEKRYKIYSPDTQTLGCKIPNRCLWCNAELPDDVLFQEKHMTYIHGMIV